MFRVQMYVEDAVSAQGPIPVDVNPNITVGELKLQVSTHFKGRVLHRNILMYVVSKRP